MVLHGHEDCVHHDAQGDGELCKGICHNSEEKCLELHPCGAALPDQILLSQAGQAGGTPLSRLLEFCNTDVVNDSCQPCIASDLLPTAFSLDLIITNNHHLQSPFQPSISLITISYFFKFLQSSNSILVFVSIQSSKPQTLYFLTAHHLCHVLTSQLTQSSCPSLYLFL